MKGAQRFWRSLSCFACLVVAGCTFQPPLSPAEHSDKPIISKSSDPQPRPEPRSRYGNPKSYEQFGRRYVIMDTADGFAERGIASWYGPKFHGKRTSSGEPYDMYAMTAAHKTLPIPVWVQVTNLKNQRSVLVRVNDRGPFVENRVIDLSHEAAKRLDMIRDGTGLVDVRVVEFNAEGLPRVTTTPIEPPAAVIVRETEKTAPRQIVKPVPADVPEPQPEVTVSADATATDAQEVAANAPMVSKKDTVNLFAQIGAFGNIDNAERLFIRLRDAGVGRVDIVDSEDQLPKLYRVRVGPVYDSESYDTMVRELNTRGIDKVTLVIETAAGVNAGIAGN